MVFLFIFKLFKQRNRRQTWLVQRPAFASLRRVRAAYYCSYHRHSHTSLFTLFTSYDFYFYFLIHRFVEIMATVFSRDAWRCAWHMIQACGPFPSRTPFASDGLISPSLTAACPCRMIWFTDGGLTLPLANAWR